MIEIQGNFHNHHRVAAAANCIIIGSKSFVSHISTWSQCLVETILIFSPASSRWNLNRLHHAEASPDMLGCVQASLAGLEKKNCGDLYANAGACEEVCESVRSDGLEAS